MDMSSLFSPDSGIGSVLNARPSAHITFKAGILTRDEATNAVTPDERKGIVRLVNEENLLHWQWRPRNSSTIEHDLILFPPDNELKLVTSAPASARVYVLKWRGESQRFFIWMQGKDASRDEAIVAQVNNILTNGLDNAQTSPHMSSTPTAPSEIPVAPSVVRDVPMGPAPATPEPPAVAQAPAPAPISAPSTAAPPQPTSPAPSAFQPITLDQMRAALPSRGGASLADAQRELIVTTPSLSDLLNPEALAESLTDERLQALLPDLLQHLPEQDRSVSQISEILRSPPLRAQAVALSHALRSGQAAELIRSFEMPTPPNMSMYGLRAFLDALLEMEKQGRDQQE